MMKPALPALLLLALVACASGDDRTFAFPEEGEGPDEFAILPNRPLAEPESYTALPEPTPGAGNLADIRPEIDVAQALGGSGARTSGVAAADGTLLAYVARDGVESRFPPAEIGFDIPYINSPLGRIRWVGPLGQAFGNARINPNNELERFEEAGLPVPSAPRR